MRRPLIVANWKMNKTAAEAAPYIRRLSEILQPRTMDVVIAPPYPALYPAAQSLSGTAFGLAGQNLFWEDKGAYTGEVSPIMLADLGCRYVIIGHSERRHVFGEDDTGVNKKVLAALRHGLRPILCVGETLSERETGVTEAVVTRQVVSGLAGCDADHVRTVAIAYEPVWAIGTGRAATPTQATEVHRLIRRTVANAWHSDVAGALRILYGGSVTAENAAPFLTAPDIDGVLVGGACLDPDGFARIARSAEEAAAKEL